MFGYASDETRERMPMPIILAHRISRAAGGGAEGSRRPRDRVAAARRQEPGVGRVRGRRPVGVRTVVVSTQHAERNGSRALAHGTIKDTIIDEVIRPVLEKAGMDGGRTKFLVNPTGRFVIGGPHGDAGLTGRKIIVDTYGGMARHGGGAFSGKDPSKVDRSAAYAARWVAKNIVDAGLARRCEVQVAYAIGVAQPVSVMVDTFGTGEVPDAALEKAVREVFDLTPRGIIKALKLEAPIYSPTAAYGHFGRRPTRALRRRGPEGRLLHLGTERSHQGSALGGLGMLEVTVSDIGLDRNTNSPVVILRERDGARILPIWIGAAEANAIAMELKGVKAQRPLTHDLLKQIIVGLGGDLRRVVISSVKENTYFAELLIHRDGHVFQVDARPSDSIALALRLNAPIFTSDQLLDQSGLQTDEPRRILARRGQAEGIPREDGPAGFRQVQSITFAAC